MKNRIAPHGKIWQCMYCGKLSKDKYGDDKWGDSGWDESCMLNAVLVDEIEIQQKNVHYTWRDAIGAIYRY